MSTATTRAPTLGKLPSFTRPSPMWFSVPPISGKIFPVTALCSSDCLPIFRLDAEATLKLSDPLGHGFIVVLERLLNAAVTFVSQSDLPGIGIGHSAEAQAMFHGQRIWIERPVFQEP